VFDISATNTDKMNCFHLPELTLGMNRIGSLEELSSKELKYFTQLLITWLIRGIKTDSCVITLQIGAMSRGWFMSYNSFLDPCDFINYRKAPKRSTWMDIMEDYMTHHQYSSRHRFMSSFPIYKLEWDNMWIDCIIGSSRV